MDALIEDNLISEKELTSANKCRLYLRVTMLSDITSASGNQLIEGFLKGTCQEKEDVQRYPEQGWPTDNDWNTWGELITNKFLHNTLPDTAVKLQRYLGSWLDRKRKGWRWFYNEGKDWMYKLTHAGITEYLPRGDG